MCILLIKIKEYLPVSIGSLFVLVFAGIIIYSTISVLIMLIFRSELLKTAKIEISKIIKRGKSG